VTAGREEKKGVREAHDWWAWLGREGAKFTSATLLLEKAAERANVSQQAAVDLLHVVRAAPSCHCTSVSLPSLFDSGVPVWSPPPGVGVQNRPRPALTASLRRSLVLAVHT
jgi:hypothetical protein